MGSLTRCPPRPHLAPRMPAHVRIEGRSSLLRSKQRLVHRFATRMLRALGLNTHELSVLLCDDTVMRRLNRAYRNQNRSTDVLAFAMREGPPSFRSIRDDILGDVAISWPTAARQARAHGWSSELEVCMLLAHGLLHVLGFDHATRVQERRMRARTDVLMMAALTPTAGVDKLRERRRSLTADHS